MPSTSDIERFLDLRRIAVVGVSRDARHHSRDVYRHLRRDGRTLCPVNDEAGFPGVEGDVGFPSLSLIPHPIDGVLVLVPAAEAIAVVTEAIGLDVRHVWLHDGLTHTSLSPEAVDLCHQADVAVIGGECPLMFDEPVDLLHRVERVLASHEISI